MRYLIIALAAGLTACGGNTTKQLDYRTRALIDSLTRQQNEVTALEIERYCKDSFDILVQRAVDSLLIVRQREIEAATGAKSFPDTTGIR